MKFNHSRRHGDCVTRTVCVFRLEVGPSPLCPWTSKTSKVNHTGSNFSEYLLCSTNNVLNGILVSITYNTRIAPFIYFHYKEIKMLAVLYQFFHRYIEGNYFPIWFTWCYFISWIVLKSFFNAHFIYFIADQVRVLCTSPMKCWVSFSKRMHYTPMQLCYYVDKHNTYWKVQVNDTPV